jgi:hypothetical protein
MERNSAVAFGSGVAFVVVIAVMFGMFVPQTEESKDIFIVKNSGGESTECPNVGSGTEIIKNSTSGNCFVRSIVGSGDISVTNTSNTIIIDFNGTIASGESTQCFNVGSGTVIIKNSTSGNCYVKSLVAGTGITITNGTDTITITNSAPDNTTCVNVGSYAQVFKDGECNFRTIKGSADISVVQGTNDITIDYNGTLVSESTVCSGQSGNYNIVASSSGGNCTFKNFVAGTSISISSNSTHITITNTAPDDTTCVDLGHGGGDIYKDGECNFRGIASGTGITVTQNTTDVSIKTNFANGTGISITGSNQQTFTNTGVISNSCSAGITCSGTNPSTFTVKYELLCQNSLSGGPATSLSCSNFINRNNLFVQAIILTTTNTMVKGYQFNSDTATNYAYRTSNNGGADATVTNTNQCESDTGSTPSGDAGVLSMYIENLSSKRKLIYGTHAYGGDTADTTAPGKIEMSCKWDNSSNAITTITLMRVSGTGQYASGTEITVWGYDS